MFELAASARAQPVTRSLAIVLPELSLEVTRRWQPELEGQPLVLLRRERNRVLVRAASPEARARGIRVGTLLSEARVRCPTLREREELPELGAQALRLLAGWARARLGPRVAFAGADGLLVDVLGTAPVHGNEEGLLRLAHEGVRRAGHCVRLGLADAPETAVVLARFGPQPLMRIPAGASEAERLRVLGSFPLRALRLERETRRRLSKLGLERIEQLLALPRRSLPARLGQRLLDRLDLVLGRRLEPMAWLEEERPCAVRRDLGELGVTSREILQEACAELVPHLLTELSARAQAPRLLALSAELEERPGELELLRVRLAAPSLDPRLLRGVLREQLERASLRGVSRAHPVLALWLRALETATARAEQLAIFMNQAAQHTRDTALVQLLTRLELRLGPRRVLSCVRDQDPRPEHALRGVPASEALFQGLRRRLPGDASGGGSLRPTRILPDPRFLRVILDAQQQPLAVEESGQSWPVAFRRGPERVETAWWEAGGVRRDYYLLGDPTGRALWLFRDLSAPEPVFYLQGLFA